jgi:hypothetical protein
MSTALDEVLSIRGKPRADGEVTISGHDPVHPTRFKVAETLAAVHAGIGVAVSDIWELKTGRRQQTRIDVRHAAAAVKSAYYLQRPDANGVFQDIVNPEHEHMRRMTQPWPTRDGRWFLPHFGLPNLRARVLKVLECEATPEAVGKAVARWNALDLEAAIDEARACGGMVRSHEEWIATPHGSALANKPVVEIIKIADSAPEPLPKTERPLDGLRVLDLTRILAGPMSARTLAEHGADVLMVTADHLPHIPEHLIDTNHGKRSCFLDLTRPDEAATLRALVAKADVFTQGYRKGVMDRFGFSPDELTRLRPGIIYTSINCYGHEGPFSHRAGWEQLGQTVTGICHENGVDGRPTLLPVPACDYTTGGLAAYGTLLALTRRAREGGSYHVRVSLCQSGMFIRRQGNIAPEMKPVELTREELAALRIESQTHDGPIRHLGPCLQLSETQPRWVRPTPKLGSHPPAWLQ